MRANQRDFFTTINTEGALQPADLVQRIAEFSSDLEGRKPANYHLAGEKINEVRKPDPSSQHSSTSFSVGFSCVTAVSGDSTRN